MSAPSVLGRASGASAASDTRTHAITLPASISAGNRLVVVFSIDRATVEVYPDESVSGKRWERIGRDVNGSVVTGYVFSKIAEGSDALTLISDEEQQSSHVSLRVDAANRISAAFSNGSSTNSDPPNLALSEGSPSPEVLWIATRSGDSTVVASAAPSGYSNLQSQAAAGTGGASTNTAEKAATADSENPGTFTSTTEQWVCATIALWNGVEQAARVSQLVVEVLSTNVADDAAPSSGGPQQLIICM